MMLVLGAVGAFVAFTVGGLVGFASSLLLLPVLLLLGVPLTEAVALNLALTVLTRLPSVVLLRAHVDLPRTTRMLVGTLPGIAGGVLLLVAVPAVVLEVAAGAVVVLSGLHLWRARPVTVPRVGPTAPVVAGACSGLLGVTTSLNGVPPVVLLARSGAPVRTRLADLSLFFVVGNCLTLVVLICGQGSAAVPDPMAAAAWLVAGSAGNLVGLWLAERLDQHRFDALTIALVSLSGVVTLVKVAADAVG